MKTLARKIMVLKKCIVYEYFAWKIYDYKIKNNFDNLKKNCIQYSNII